MTTDIQNLWPAFSGDHLPESPVSVLRQQAAYLKEMTDDKIEAEVRSRLNRKSPAFEFEHTLVIWPAERPDSSIEFVKIRHGVGDYPLENAVIGHRAKIENNIDFEIFLTELFHSPETAGLIRNLLDIPEGVDGASCTKR